MSNQDDSTAPTQCTVCQNETQEGVECDQCNQWSCRQCITQGIPNMFPDPLYAALNAKDEFPWTCKTCSQDNVLQQMVTNQVFTKEELAAFGCNDVILGMIKASEGTTQNGQDAAAPTTSQRAHQQANTTDQQQSTSTAQSSTVQPTPVVDPNMQMMMTLITTMAQNQRDEIKAIVDALKPQLRPQDAMPITQVNTAPFASNLPKIQLATFDGNDVTQWHAFWESFTLNVHNQPISDRHKMDFLCQQIKGQAFNKIKGLGSDGDKYTEAIRILQSYYGNPVFQKRAYWDTLHSLPTVKDSLVNLERFNDDLRSTVLAMERCGIRDDALDGYVPEISKKLPSNLVMKMNEMRMMQGKAMDDVTMSELVQFIQQYMEVVAVSQTKPFKKPDNTAAESKFNTSNFSKPIPTISLAQQTKQRANGYSSTSNSNNRRCIFCNGTSHYSDDCRTVATLQTRRKQLVDAKRCFNCLGTGHLINNCRRFKPCFHCKRQGHHSAVCPSRNSTQSNQMAGQVNQMSDNDQQESTVDVQANLNQMVQDDGIVMPTFPCQVMNPETKEEITLLVYADGGARRTCISSEAASLLHLKSKKSVSLVVGRFNTNDEDIVEADLVEATLCGPNGFKLNIDGYSVPQTAPPLKRGPIKLSRIGFAKLRQANPINSPPGTTIKQPIDIMLGQDYLNRVFGPHVKADHIQNELYVFHTKLGRILSGNARRKSIETTQSLHNMACFNVVDPVENLWKLDAIGISSQDKMFNRKDEEVMQRFSETMRKADGRYEVGFPWKQQPCQLSSNYHVAKQRLQSTVKMLTADKAHMEQFNQYHDIINDQLEKGVIEKVEPQQQDGPIKHYIAHFPVIRNDKSTTKTRIVYDASVPTKAEKKSLNDLMYAGPCMLNDLTGILLRFRMSKAVMVSDIEKAFLQVGLQLEDRDATRFLWLKDPNNRSLDGNIQVYRFARLPFGIIASPHLLGATIKFHLNQYGDSSLAAQLQRNIYVDNVIININEPSEAPAMYREAKKMFKDVKMNLREWVTNDEWIKNAIPQDDKANNGEIKILGIKWDSRKDTINVTKEFKPHKDPTKRQILSTVAGWYDPLGLVSPITLQPRVLIQTLWKMELNWDDAIPSDKQAQWSTCSKELELIPSITLPRQAGTSSVNRSILVAFTDASQTAYATCIYLWQETEHGIQSNLVFSKARLAPLKPAMTIPKLELTGALIGARALRFVKSQLDINVEKMVLWTDSQIVLHWLNSTKELPPYVTRRKDEILKDDEISCYYVPTKSNPADLATRGCTVAQLLQSTWFNGPQWLQNSPNSWPKWEWNYNPEVDRTPSGSSPDVIRKLGGSGPELTRKLTGCEPEVTGCEPEVTGCEPEVTGCQAEVNRKNPASTQELFNIGQINAVNPPVGISNVQKPKRSLMSTLRTTAYVLRFINNLKKNPSSSNSHNTGNILLTDEINRATQKWINTVQETHFAEEIKLVKCKKFNQLIKQLDLHLINGVLCCGGRLGNAFDNPFPILLPRNHEFTKLVILDAHEKVFHYGIKATLAHLRQKYWIPHGYSQVRKVLRPCITCRRVQGQSFTAPRMAALPLERVQRAAAFKFTGLDYMGPLHVKEQGEYQKKWVALFTCFTTRAVHLEVVDDCSTEALTQAMIRFIGRRGKPTQILSDNATQFKKGANVFNAIFGNQVPANAIDELTTFFTSNQIHWKFIPESSPWVGGFYERMVGVVKRALKKVLWKSAINTTTLQTVLIQLEGVINTRPLMIPTSDPAEKPLCPANFIGPSTQLAVPPSDDDPNDPEYVPDNDTKKSLLRQWQLIEKKLNSFWKIWQTQYLQELRESHQVYHRYQHGSVNRQPKVGEVCLIKETTPRATWKMGRIESLIHGADDEVRFVNIMLPTKHVTRRGVKDLVPLEAEFQDNTVNQPDGNAPRPGEDVDGGRQRI